MNTVLTSPPHLFPAKESFRCSEEAGYVHQQLRRIGWYATHSPMTSTVILRRPPDEICKRFGLEVQKMYATLRVHPETVRPELDDLISAVENSVQVAFG